jgi:hypothetical protein
MKLQSSILNAVTYMNDQLGRLWFNIIHLLALTSGLSYAVYRLADFDGDFQLSGLGLWNRTVVRQSYYEACASQRDIVKQ